ncbi:unnamed protein product [Umbelopsis sp. WA50703]
MNIRNLNAVWVVTLLLVIGIARNPVTGQVLSVQSIQSCEYTPDIILNRFNLTYYVSNQTVYFDMAGTSNKELLNATADLTFLLYGSNLYNTSYSLCSFNQSSLCPILANSTFNFTGWQPLPQQFINQIPAFIFGLPDLGLQTKVTIQSPTTINQSLCIVTSISNPEAASFQNPVPQWLSLGLLIGTIVSGVISFIYAFFDDGQGLSSAVSSSSSPRVTDIVLFFQHVSYSGQMAFNYPDMYRSFTANFAWAMGLISIPFIDNAASTGTTQSSNNSTANYLVHIMKRADILPMGSTPSNTSATGIKAYVEILLYTIAKALILGLAQSNGEAQAIANLCIEALFFLGLVVLRPYPVIKSNFFQGLMSFVRLLGFALLVACATVFAVDVATKSKLGLALVVLHSATGVLLYILMILNILTTLLRKKKSRNPKLAPEEKSTSENSLNAPPRTEPDSV